MKSRVHFSWRIAEQSIYAENAALSPRAHGLSRAAGLPQRSILEKPAIR